MAAAAAAAAALDPSNSSKNTLKIENFDKRNTLQAIEKKYQQQWKDNKVFEVDAPSLSEIPAGSMSAEEIHTKHPKFFGTMAYPYMNGTLHAGHSFTASKVEFMTSVARMQGKRALFPLGFHCTGMPILACADKLKDEIKKFGTKFEGYKEEEAVPDQPPAPTQDTAVDPTKFSGQKSKAAAKTIKAKYQFQIMLSIGIPLEEIHKFSDAHYWLQYFPPLAIRDLDSLGAKVDWRRQMVTTDANPYYDAFVRWQMNRLHEKGKILYGNRYTIYSPKDGQPCMDHDRTEGEGIGPQEYTALKVKVTEWSPAAAELVKGKIEDDANVYFVPATLRPETMYGQTAIFLGPKITYGIFKVGEKEYYIVTKRAAWNMAFQGIFFDSDHFPKTQDQLPLVAEGPGSTFIGTGLSAPLSVHETIRILPMETVSATKGTGVVTSVPSDSPDDYATIADLAKKADYYGIKKEWAELEIPPIIETPTYGNLTAPALVKQMKINSPKDATQLALAKDLAYSEGFYKGTMLVGEFKGEAVQTAKDKVRQSLVKDGAAFAFADPSGKVVSRSGDDCVVAYLGQWFLNYGENDAEWQKTTLNHVVNGMNTYSVETRNGFEKNLDWLNRWACARTYGLGSRLPWDPQFLVESLSDSTIYMAYYTISHLLHGDRFGKTPGLLPDVKPENMIDDVWDYIFTRRELDDDLIQKSGISKENFLRLRREFEYFYPLDVRVSGKDLIQNHLTFLLYIHVALFPEELWPRSIRINGHLLLNGEKMSKSTGNFLTLKDSVDKYGADATRIAFADAGDAIEDANFDETVANSNILRLFTLKEWIEEVSKDDTLRTGPTDVLWDKLFTNELNALVREAKTHYDDTNFKLALRSALYDFVGARDTYREATTAAGIGMHRDVVTRYIELQALMLAPIAPHWSEYVWLEVLKKGDTIHHQVFPEVPEADVGLSAAAAYIRSTSSSITSSESNYTKKLSKGRNVSFDPRKPKKITIYAAKNFPAWQEKYIDLVRESFDSLKLTVDDKGLNAKVGKLGEMKKAMPFVQGLKRRLINSREAPDTVFSRKLPYDEIAILQELVTGIKRTTGAKEIEIISVDEGGKSGTVVGTGEKRENLQGENAVPGQPSFTFVNIE
ncbi:uncharacterized protein TRUGW13939_10533 [Talaromyces rugulosus]|uniref:leucine--tRNA ligase n=1 Tax=Talaromyces rugulosus TaxID=121627 RepID=A0A7H8RFN6_TALRU|nr:uncharacterized protein TRUGW13939_10533 [Talaromyces rugulosus]QKX63363.1 hypothetical protein TRUGW13939_10533 [Talaromyces rugulosus]